VFNVGVLVRHPMFDAVKYLTGVRTSAVHAHANAPYITLPRSNHATLLREPPKRPRPQSMRKRKAARCGVDDPKRGAGTERRDSRRPCRTAAARSGARSTVAQCRRVARARASASARTAAHCTHHQRQLEPTRRVTHHAILAKTPPGICPGAERCGSLAGSADIDRARERCARVERVGERGTYGP
jgi:hypothetical protein